MQMIFDPCAGALAEIHAEIDSAGLKHCADDLDGAA